MTDITAELAALPKMPTHIAACQHSQYGHLCSRIAMGTKIHALEVRLAIAERLLKSATDHLEFCGYGDSYERECAREAHLPQNLDAYLAHRAKEKL